MDATAPVWALQGWRDKLAAGFTHSAAPSGDKLGTLHAARGLRGAARDGLGRARPAAVVRGRGGVAAATTPTGSAATSARWRSRAPAASGSTEGDLATGVAPRAARRRARVELALEGVPRRSPPRRPGRRASRPRPAGASRRPSARRSPASRRTNLRELAARPERFEHHLVVVARAAGAQLEIATASEPLYFAHVNVSRRVRGGAADGRRARSIASRCARSSPTRARSRTSAATTIASAISCCTRSG